MYSTILLSGALAATVAWCVARGRRHTAEIGLLRDDNVRIQTEERRVFDFLHGIGEALKDESHISDLNGLIVEGALRILEAQGGALYLVSKGGGALYPAYVSKGCPPFVEIRQQPAAATADAVQRELRVQSVRPGEGLVGGVFTGGAPVFLAAGDPRLAPLPAHGATSAFIAPLSYAGRNMGVLAVARTGSAPPFGPDSFEVFKGLADQSAFSLFDAFLHSEAAEKRQIEKDLQIANEVQRILLPSESPQIEGYELAGTNLPARYVSGDYFDFIPLDEDRCGVAIADVSGKGIPAALLMAMVRTALRLLAGEHPSPAEVIKRVNAQLYPDIKEDMFISMAYAILDRRTPEIRLVRAGHDAPLIYRRKDGSVTPIESKGMAVGIDSGGAFNRVTTDFSLVLEPGDCLVLYTDGVTEALDRSGDEFGLEAMIRSVQASAPEGASGIVRRVTGDVRAFIGEQSPHDDITMITIFKK